MSSGSAIATRHLVTARSVDVRLPPSRSARSPTTAPGPELRDHLAVDLDREHAVEQEEELAPFVALLDERLPLRRAS